MINIAIVEDEHAASALLKEYIERWLETDARGKGYDRRDMRIMQYYNGSTFLNASSMKFFDIVFMDIRLPDVDGMTISEELRKTDKNAVIVFVTDIAQFAMKGYKVDALDYVLKPVSYYNFSVVLDRAFERLEKSTDVCVTVRVDNRIARISAADIKYVEVMNHKLIYHTKYEDIVGYGQLKDVENALGKAEFIQCHRYYLVNLKYVKSMSNGMLDVDGTLLEVSVRKRKDVLAAVANYFGGGGVR